MNNANCTETLIITEIYKSIQGESTFAGLPCTFVRLTGCPLRCRWCDTVYGFKGGETYTIDRLFEQIKAQECQLVEITGGEPLAQSATPQLISKLIANGYKVLIETSGSECIAALHPRTHVIMDLKCPGSGMEDKNLYANIGLLKETDEVKFVIADRRDFDWAVSVIRDYRLEDKVQCLVSPAFGLMKPDQLVEWLLESKLNARLNLQIHKFIWSPKAKGV